MITVTVAGAPIRRCLPKRYGKAARALIAGLLLASAAGCSSVDEPARTAVPPAPVPLMAGVPGGWKLVADDEFNGSDLDPRLWRTAEPWAAASGYDESPSSFCPAAAVHDLVSVADGSLNLRARSARELPEPAAGQPISSKPILSCFAGTRDRFSFVHGYLEARVHLPAGRGLWPAFWLLGNGVGQQGWPRTGEIDVAEFVNNGPDDGRLFSTLHFAGPCPDKHCADVADLQPGSTVPDYQGRWITLGLARSEDSIHVFLDGRLLYSFDRHSTDAHGNVVDPVLFDGPMHVRFDLQAGGWAATPDQRVDNGTFSIDYLRAWEARP